jgi:hypothetical protein
MRLHQLAFPPLAAVLLSLLAPGVARAGDDEDIDDDGAPSARAEEEEQEAKRKPKKKSKLETEDEVDDAEDVDAAGGQMERDGARFRGGVSVEGGVLAIPDSSLTMGAVGVQGQVGAQINHLVGVYWVPSLDILVGPAGGVNVASAVLVDFTIIDMISIGVGPDVGAFAAIGTNKLASGANYGARLHFAVHPVFGRGDDGIRRKAFSIGLESRFLGGPVVTASTTDADATLTGFIVQPMLTVGYTAM